MAVSVMPGQRSSLRRLRLRQVALVARDLEAALADLAAVFELPEPYRDPGVEIFGLANGVFAVGDTFLEVVSPVRERTSAGRFLDRRGGDGGYMVIVQARDIDSERARLQGLGVRIVWEAVLEDMATLHVHPTDIGGAIVSVDTADPPESWRWAGPKWAAKPPSTVAHEIVGVELEAREPNAMAVRWSQVLGSREPQPCDGGYTIDLGRGRVRFVTAGGEAGEGVRAVELAAAASGAGACRERVIETARERGLETTEAGVRVCGTEFRLLEAAGSGLA